MRTETAIALEESITHWEENVAAETWNKTHTGWGSCALCRSFFLKECQGCPVKMKTGKPTCEGTPYGFADDRLERWGEHRDSEYMRRRWRKAAQAELDFLKSLREGT